MKTACKIGILICGVYGCVAFGAFDYAAWSIKRDIQWAERDVLRSAYSNLSVKVSSPAQNVASTLETFQDGSVKMLLNAGLAQAFAGTDYVWAKDVVVTKFDESGKIVAKVIAERCLLNRGKKNGWVEGHAHIEQGETQFDGDYVYFSAPDGYCFAMTNTVVVSKDVKSEAL